MVIRQNKPLRSDKPTEHYSIIQEKSKTKRLFGAILLIGTIVVVVLLLISIIVGMICSIKAFNQLIEYIRIYWGAFSFGLTCGLASGKMLKAFKYFLND